MKTYGVYETSKDTLINNLLKMLREHPLDRRFEVFGNFYQTQPKMVNFETRKDGAIVYHCDTLPEDVVHVDGNFFTYSYSFSIWTDEEEIKQKLLLAIDENQHRLDYLSQEKPIEEKKYLTVVKGIRENWINGWSDSYLKFE